MAGLYHFTTRDAAGQKRYDREQLVAWARERFHVDLDMDDLRNKQRDEIRQLLVEHSRRRSKSWPTRLWPRFTGSVDEYLRRRAQPVRHRRMASGGNGAMASLTDWLAGTAGVRSSARGAWPGSTARSWSGG